MTEENEIAHPYNASKLIEKWSKLLNSQNKNPTMLIEPMETFLYDDKRNEPGQEESIY